MGIYWLSFKNIISLYTILYNSQWYIFLVATFYKYLGFVLIPHNSTNSEDDWIELPNASQRKHELHNVFYFICLKLPKVKLAEI